MDHSIRAGAHDTEELRHAIGHVAASLGAETRTISTHLSSGKLLRGRLVMSVAALADGELCSDSALHAATQIELIHAGALIHDDLMDGSTERRGRPTLWKEIGARPALLTGVAVMSLAAAELASAPDGLRRQIAGMIREVARGQTDELSHLYATGVSPDAHRRRARAKTGTLYELAARLGAAAGGLDACATDTLARYGAKLGLGFQLADDVRDLVGGPALGRAPGTDLRVGVYTLPVLATLAGRFRDGERLRALLVAARTGHSLAECVELLRINGALEATATQARTLAREAVAHLTSLSSLRGRFVLEAYASELLGPVGVASIEAAEESGTEQIAREPEEDGRPIDPALRLLLHRTLSTRLPALTRPAGGTTPLARAIGAAGALVLLADEIDASDPRHPDSPPGSATRARLVGSIDLLFAEFWNTLVALPGAVAAMVARRLAALALDRTQLRGSARFGGASVEDDLLVQFAEDVTDAARC